MRTVTETVTGGVGGCSVNRKTKGEMKALREKHAQCYKWLFLCNGAPSWMEEDVEMTGSAKKEEKGDMVSIMQSLQQLQEENKKLGDQMKNLTPKTEEAHRQYAPKLYPWVPKMPSAPPPPYMMPMMTFEGGHVHGPDGQTGIVLGGIADV